jgi:tRNA threonylcarbamoyladenosine modification (KEOPS) complex  Pcc1 subunit
LQRQSKQGNSLRENMPFELRLQIAFANSAQALAIAESIKPEIGSRHNLRSETIVKIKNSCISINIKALDKTALRASLNSCLKSIILAKEILEVK